MLVSCRRASVALFLHGVLLAAQSAGFDDLAQRAQASLDADPAQAVTLYTEALRLRPQWAEGWTFRGAGLLRLERYPDAEESLKKSIALAPDSGTAWGFLALAAYGLHDYDGALANAMKGETLGLGANPGFESAVRQSAAFALIRQGRFDEAIGQLQPLAKYGDKSQGVIIAAGLCALASAQLPEQIAASQMPLIQLAGEAQWAATSNRPQEADQLFRTLLASFGTAAGVHYAYGLYLMESDQEAALKEFRTETAAHPDAWAAWLVSASLETKAGAPETALADVDKALPLVPAAARWRCNVEAGKAHQLLGKTADAVADFQRAIRTHPEYPQLHFYLSQAYGHLGRHADAQREKAEFLRLNAPPQ